MSLFGKIMSTIFGGSAQAAPAASPAAAASGASTAAPGTSVDVTGILDKLADDHAEDLDWRKSIVDLMKLVGIDSSLSNRRELAQELGYTGSTKDTATMNIWLHKQVMAKLAANGGNVPKELLD
jgi:hypothetical protein